MQAKAKAKSAPQVKANAKAQAAPPKVHEKARAKARAERIVREKDKARQPKRRQSAASALDAAAASHAEMERKVQAKLQVRVAAGLRRVRKLCQSADAVMPPSEDKAVLSASGNTIEFLEGTLRQLKQHGQHLGSLLRRKDTGVLYGLPQYSSDLKAFIGEVPYVPGADSVKGKRVVSRVGETCVAYFIVGESGKSLPLGRRE